MNRSGILVLLLSCIVTLAASKGAEAQAMKTASGSALKGGMVSANKASDVIKNVKHHLDCAIAPSQDHSMSDALQAIYEFVADADGAPVFGGQKYVIHFARNQLPPAGASWSLSMRGGGVAPGARSIIRSQDALNYNQDGSLDVFIAHDDPGWSRRANWLPSPASGATRMALCLFAAREGVLDPRWRPPRVRREVEEPSSNREILLVLFLAAYTIVYDALIRWGCRLPRSDVSWADAEASPSKEPIGIHVSASEDASRGSYRYG